MSSTSYHSSKAKFLKILILYLQLIELFFIIILIFEHQDRN